MLSDPHRAWCCVVYLKAWDSFYFSYLSWNCPSPISSGLLGSQWRALKFLNFYFLFVFMYDVFCACLICVVVVCPLTHTCSCVCPCLFLVLCCSPLLPGSLLSLPPISPLEHWDYTWVTLCSASAGSQDSNSGPQACRVNALTPENLLTPCKACLHVCF